MATDTGPLARYGFQLSRRQASGGRGLTFAKLPECQYVMDALGDLPLRVAYERLAGMVRMLGEDVQAIALHNAYAIDMPAPGTLTRRRERIAGIHGLSIDTIELHERNMIDEWALRLVHGELPVGSLQAGRVGPPDPYAGRGSGRFT